MTNDRYNRPAEGTDDWHEPLNANFESLDRDVIVKGPHDERPDDPDAGTWYLSTDRRWLSWYDGDAWLPVGGLGTADTPVPGVTGVESIRTGGLDVGDTSDLPGSLRVAKEGPAAVSLQNVDDTGDNNARKVEFRLYNDDGTSKLGSFAPAEVKPERDGDGTVVADRHNVEWSNYIRDTPVSASGESLKKWLNVTTEGTERDGEFWPRVEFLSLDGFGLEAGAGRDLRCRLVADGDSPANDVVVDWMAADPAGELDAKSFLEQRLDRDALAFRWRDRLDDAPIARYDFEGGALSIERPTNFAGSETRRVVWESGDASDRPSTPVEGERFFDAELGQPIWYDGEEWVDAMGDPA